MRRKLPELFTRIRKNILNKSAAVLTASLMTAFFAFISSHDLKAQKTSFAADTPIMEDEEPVSETGDLTIIQATPSGNLDSADIKREIVVMFSRPMVPLGTLEKETKGAFQISPKVKGSFRWYGSRVCAFIPDEAYMPATDFTITVPKGIKSLDGKTLSETYQFSFSTPRLKVTGVYGGYGRIPYDREIRISFNLPVEINDVKKHLTLKSGNTDYAFQLKYSEKIDSANLTKTEIARRKQNLVMTPAKPYGRDEVVRVVISKDLKPIGGSTGLKSDFVKYFRTYGPLTVEYKQYGRYFSDLYGYKLIFNNPVQYKDLIKAVHIEPAAEPYERNDYQGQYFSMSNWRLKPATHYTVTFPNGLKDAYGNELSNKNITIRFTTPRKRRRYDTDRGFFTFESQMPHRVSVRATGMDEMFVSVTPYGIEELLDYANQTKYTYGLNLSFRNDDIWNLGLRPNDSALKLYDINPYLQNNLGWLAVRMSGSVENWRGDVVTDTAIKHIQITDMGIVAKESNGFSDIWVHSLSSGKPYAKTTVSMYEGAEKISSCLTDALGHCRIKNDFDPQYMPRKKIVYVADNGRDKAYVINRHDSVSMWGLSPNFDIYAKLPVMSGVMFFDRKLYRPGDKVFIKAFLGVRKDGKIYYTKEHLGDIYVTLTDSRGNKLLEKEVELSDEGGTSLSYIVPPDSPLGHYSVTFRSRSLGETSDYHPPYINDTFQVEEFRPVSFAVSSSGFENSYIGNKIKIGIEGKYLFGAPMQNAPVQYSISQKPWNIYVDSFAEYVFGDTDYGDIWEAPGWAYYSGQSGKLDKKGFLEADFTMPELLAIGYEKDQLSRHYQLELEARVTDIDDKTVTHKKTVNVYAGKELPGIKTHDRYQSYKDEFEFNFIALSAEEHLPVTANATVIIHRKEWHSIQTKGPGDTSQRKNRLVRVEVLRKKVKLDKTPLRFLTKVSKPGSYTITLKIDNSKAFSRTDFYAYGGGYIGWDFHEDDTLTLLPDKGEYKPGDTAKILIQSPFKKSTAIVTVERESVIWQKSYEIEGNGEPIEIPIQKSFIPNVYVSVVLLRPRAKDEAPKNGKDIGRPMFKAGIVKLNVNTSTYRLPLEIQSDKKTYGPGDDISVQIKTVPGAEVAISVADRAVLDLVNYSFIDPIARFYDNWAHGVSILENRHSIIEQLNYSNKGDSPGGKGELNNVMANGGFREDSEDGMRKEFLQTAYWSEKKIADKNGNITIQFRLPHNLTTFRIMAAAAKDGKYQSTSQEFQVQKPVVLQTSLPRFIRPEDRLQMGAVIVNQSGTDGKFKVTFESDLLTNDGKFIFEKTVFIEDGASVEVSFPLEVDQRKYAEKKTLQKQKYVENFDKKNAKEIDFDVFMAAGVKGKIKVEPLPGEFKKTDFDPRHLKDGMTFELPVREISPREAFTIAGYTETKETEMVQIPKEGSVSPYYGGLELEVSSTALLGLSNGFDFYRSNPYFCLEQRTSAFLLALTSGELLKSFGLEPPSGQDYDFQNIARIFLDELPKFQNSNGGFRLWKDDPYKISYPYLTAHVVFTLQVMQESKSGYPFPGEVYSKAVRYLLWFMANSHKDSRRYLYETRAFINYVLARDGKGHSLFDTALLAKKEYLSLRSKAYLAMAIAKRSKTTDYRKNKTLQTFFEEFKNRMQFTTRSVYFDEPVYGSYGRTWYSTGSTMSALIRAFISMDEKNPLISKMVRAAVGEQSHTLWNDSHSTGLLAYALWKYHKKYEKTDEEMIGIVSFNDKSVFAKKFLGLRDALGSKTIEMEKLLSMGTPGKNYPLEFKIAKGGGRLYYSGTLYYSPLKNADEPRDEGIEIRREVFAMSEDDIRAGRTVQKFERGKAYLYRITVINPKPVYYFVLTDPLPANVEVVNTGFQTESALFGRFLQEQRSGGYGDYWWMEAYPVYEYRDDRVLIFLNYLSPGIHEYFYIGRGISKGDASYPAAEGFGMYTPEIFGRTGTGSHIVE